MCVCFYHVNALIVTNSGVSVGSLRASQHYGNGALTMRL